MFSGSQIERIVYMCEVSVVKYIIILKKYSY